MCIRDSNDPDQEILVKVYDEYIAGSTYEDNMKSFGKVSYDAPSTISIYTDSFENKDAITACIEPVSYTHLDVYKRQPESCSIPSMY